MRAIPHHVAILTSAKNLEAAARMGAATQGLALEAASSSYRGPNSHQTVAGYMVISIPIMVTAIVKGSAVTFHTARGVGPILGHVRTE